MIRDREGSTTVWSPFRDLERLGAKGVDRSPLLHSDIFYRASEVERNTYTENVTLKDREGHYSASGKGVGNYDPTRALNKTGILPRLHYYVVRTRIQSPPEHVRQERLGH